MKLPQQIAQQLAHQRHRKRLTQRQLAQLCKISQPRISDVENAKGNPTLRSLAAIAQALDLELTIATRPAKANQ